MVWLLVSVVMSNCIGIPTTAGEIEFDDDMMEILVNAMCVGIIDHDMVQKVLAKV